MSNLQKVRVPDLGDFKEVEIIEVHVQPGDSVDVESPLITLESEKATMDIPSPAAGVVKEVKKKVEDRVSEGDFILVLDMNGPFESKPGTPHADRVDEESDEAPGATPLSAPSPSQEPIVVKMPEMGDFTEVDIIEVLTKPGDSVGEEDPLITLESDKATMDVPAPFAGVVRQVMVQAGEKISVGNPIALVIPETGLLGQPPESVGPVEHLKEPQIAQTARSTENESTSQLTERESVLRPPPVAAVPDRQQFLKAHASPSVRRFSRELGVDLSLVQGSGRKGRITREDVQKYVKATLAEEYPAAGSGTGIPPIPEVDFSKFGVVETQQLSRIKRKGGERLDRIWLNVPMVTHHDEADITELEAFRKSLRDEAAQQGVRLTLLAFLLKASAANLRMHPYFNSSLSADKQNLIIKKYIHIGVAVDTEDGLVVPVIRDVDQKGIFALASELGEFSQRARDKKLKAEEMQGGCFSISSLGGIGGSAFTPLVNAPEVAILGVTRSRMTPQWNGTKFEPKLILPLDLTYDHRVIDGAQAARFMVDLCKILSDVRRLLL